MMSTPMPGYDPKQGEIESLRARLAEAKQDLETALKMQGEYEKKLDAVISSSKDVELRESHYKNVLERIASFRSLYGPSDEAVIAQEALDAEKE